MRLLLASTVVALLLLPRATRAEAAASCHCFTDRAYDPARPASADAYILASTRSSLLSASQGVVKRALVQAVMSGADPDDLFVAHWLAPRVGTLADDLLDARKAKGSWKAALAGTPPGKLPAPFAARLVRNDPSSLLAAAAIDDVLVARAGASADALAAVRALGASNGEAIVAAVLAKATGSSPARVLEPVRAGKRSWGQVLDDAGLAPARMDALVRAQVR